MWNPVGSSDSPDLARSSKGGSQQLSSLAHRCAIFFCYLGGEIFHLVVQQTTQDLDQVDQIFNGGGRSEPDPAALLKYEFASAPTKVDQDDLDETDDGDEEYGNALLKCYFALVPSKVVLS